MSTIQPSNPSSIKVVAFDADDTLWVNEPYFQETERHFCAILENYLPVHSVEHELLKTEIENMPLYGFGVKAFMLSMVETALRVSEGHVSPQSLNRILELGKEMLQKPIELLDGVEEVLRALHGKYRLVVATKGDLLDQERKLKKSSLEPFFHHIEIMSDKQEADYQKLIRHLDIRPEEFLMIGNSLKSDILPVLKIGAWGVHVPYHLTWNYEKTDEAEIQDERFRKVERLTEVLDLIR